MIGCQCRPDKGTRSLRSRPCTPRLARESPASYPVKSLWPVIYGWNPVRVPEKLGMQAACRCSLRTRLEPELSAQALGGLWVYGSSWVWAGLQVNWLQQYYWLDKYTRKVAAPPRSFRAGPPVQTLACEGLIFTREFDIILLVWTRVPCLQHARSTSTRARWPPLCGLSAGVLEIRHSRSHGKAIRFEKTQARYLSRMVATPVLSFSAIRHHSNEHFYGFLSSVFSLP